MSSAVERLLTAGLFFALANVSTPSTAGLVTSPIMAARSPAVESIPPILAAGEWAYPDLVITVTDAPRARVVHHRVIAPAHSSVVAWAEAVIGVPYVHGGASPSGFDCSGLVSWVYAQVGISLPRTVSGIRWRGVPVSDPQPGDVIWTSGHVGIYVSPGWQIDSPRPGKTVQLRPIWQTNPLYLRIST